MQNPKEMFRYAQHDKENFMYAALCHCEATAEAIKRHRIPMILASHTVSCCARTLCSLAMTRNSIHKNIHCHVERKRNISYDSMLFDSL